MNNHPVLLEYKANYAIIDYRAENQSKFYTISVGFEYSFEMNFVAFEAFGFMKEHGSITLIFGAIWTIFLNLTCVNQ